VERSRKRMLGGNPCHGASSNRIAFDEEAIGEANCNTRTQLVIRGIQRGTRAVYASYSAP